MLRRLMLALPLLGAISLGGCATVFPSGTPTVAEIQSITVTVCGFLPTASTVANILANGNPIVATATAVANAICAAVVPTKSARLRAIVPTVNGVVVHGRFVN